MIETQSKEIQKLYNMSNSVTVQDAMKLLNQFDWDNFEEAPGKNKGKRGQAIELALGLTNNSSLLDLSDGEIKTFTQGQTIAVTQLNHCIPEIAAMVPFSQSKVGLKIANTIYIAFTKNNEFITHKNQFSCLEIEQDYNHITHVIRGAIETGSKIGTISGPNGLLQIRTKASKKKDGTYLPLVYNGHELNNKGMAFYLKGEYARKICRTTV